MRTRLLFLLSLLLALTFWSLMGIVYALETQDNHQQVLNNPDFNNRPSLIVSPLYSFNNFSDVSAFTLNGDASQANDGVQDVLRITPTGIGQVGSAFISSPIAISPNSSFETSFEFRFHPGSGADGLYFVLQNDPSGATALGGDGSGMGYTFNAGMGPITKSIGIGFNTWVNNIVRIVGVNTALGTQTLNSTNAPLTLSNGSSRFIWIDYDGSSNLLEVYLSATNTKPGTPLLTQIIDLTDYVENQAYIGFTAGTGVGSDNHDIRAWEFTQTEPPLAITKEVDTTNPIPSQLITYTISISNSSATITDAIISDTLPTGLTFAGPVSLEPNQPATLATSDADLPILASGLTITNNTLITLTFPVTVDAATSAGTIITNTASVTSSITISPTTASASIIVTAAPTPNLTLTKQVDTTNPIPSQRITYTIAISNSGATATNAVISDTLPAGLTFAGPVSLEPNQFATLATSAADLPVLANGLTITSNTRITLTFPVTVNTSVTAGTILTNTAAVTSSTIVTPATDSTSIAVVATPVPNLSLNKQVNTSTPVPGEVITYTIIVNNSGATTTDAIISDTLPTGLTFKGPVVLNPTDSGATLALSSSDLPALASGLTITSNSTITLTFPVTVDNSIAAVTLITNTASVTSPTTLSPAQDSVGTTVTLVSTTPLTPNLKITLAVDEPNPTPGERIIYTITITNDGATTFGGTVSNTLPSDLTFAGPVSVTPFQSTALVATSAVDLPTLVRGLTITQNQNIIITFPVTVNANIATMSFTAKTTIVSPITNTVSLTSFDSITPVSSFVVIYPNVNIPDEDPAPILDEPEVDNNGDDDDDGEQSSPAPPTTVNPTAVPAAESAAVPVTTLPETGYPSGISQVKSYFPLMISVGFISLLLLFVRWTKLRYKN